MPPAWSPSFGRLMEAISSLLPPGDRPVLKSGQLAGYRLRRRPDFITIVEIPWGDLQELRGCNGVVQATLYTVQPAEAVMTRRPGMATVTFDVAGIPMVAPDFPPILLNRGEISLFLADESQIDELTAALAA